jgi:hypothetical protein
MEFDPDRKFGELHKDSKALHDVTEEIINVALVEAPPDNQTLDIRFLTPRDPSAKWYLNEDCAEYELTPPGIRTRYVAVSYCWSHSQAATTSIPAYMVYDAVDSSIPPRRIKCPDMVFHRAFTFARKHRIRHVWIDQECIDQDDPADISKHLKMMDQLYAQSSYTLAVLSNTLKTPEQVSALTAMLQTTQITGTPLIDALDHVFSDTWFTRTWTMHEQYCTRPGSLRLLVPIEPDITRFSSVEPWVLGNDICLASGILQDHLFGLTYRLRRPQINGIEDQTTGLLLKWQRHFKSSAAHARTCGFTSSLNISDLAFWDMFLILQDSNNSVVADRLSIVGNVYRSPLRLLSERLDSNKYKYSTCMLALIMANRYQDRTSRFDEISQWWIHLSDCSLTDLVCDRNLLRNFVCSKAGKARGLGSRLRSWCGTYTSKMR